MRYGSLFSGIGGFDKGLDDAGMECAWQCEIEPFPVRVLERHWPQVPKYGDIREVDPRGLGRVDLICGGSPCQDVSVAGKRAGLAGERSGLFFEFVRIADAIAPKWLLFENVPGLLSSNKGEDFAVVLGEITGYRPAVPGKWRNSGIVVGPKRAAAWRVLDAQYFGVAQRRRRVFIVASAGDGSGPTAVLFEPESGSGNPPPRREAGAVAPTIPASGAGTSRTGNERTEADMLVTAATLTTAHGRRPGGRRKEDDVNLVTQALTGTFANGGADDNKAQGGFLVPDVSRALTTSNQRIDGETETFVLQSAMAFQCHGSNIGPMGTLRAGNGSMTSGVPFVESEMIELRCNCGHISTLPSLSTPCPGCGGFQGGTVNYKSSVRVVQEAQTGVREYETAGTIRADAPGTQPGGSLLRSGMSVRRLTPRECERLQGFPDDWTLLDEKTPDSPRYRGCGNAVCRNVAEWLGTRISEVDGRL